MHERGFDAIPDRPAFIASFDGAGADGQVRRQTLERSPELWNGIREAALRACGCRLDLGPSLAACSACPHPPTHPIQQAEAQLQGLLPKGKGAGTCVVS